MGKNKYQPTDAELEYDLVKDKLCKYWKNIAINIFKWNGLDKISPTLTTEIIEEYLYEKGECNFFNDEMLGYLCLPVHPYNEFNVYGKPQEFEVYGFNGYTKHLTTKNSVLIKNNPSCTPTKEMIDYYCGILADIELTKGLQRDAHKVPYILECSSETELTAKNIWNKIRSREPVIYKNKMKGDADIGISVNNTGASYINDKLEDDYNCYVAKILTYLGLDNFVQDKAERVQSAEVESNNEYVISSFKTMLDARKNACKKINEMFGLNLSVEFVVGEQIEEDKPIEENNETDPLKD